MVCGSRWCIHAGLRMIALITLVRLKTWFAGSPVRGNLAVPLSHECAAPVFASRVR